ncbi:MAG: prepilin-type N-terminal cleavage/methylation domain-containing protein [Burkholderiaceae bacterium]
MNGARGRASRRQSGFSLIELMVALVITMMASLLMFQTMTLGEGSKRTASGGNESMRAGTMVLDELSFLVRTAGVGLAQIPGAYGCALTAYRDGSQVLPSGGALPAPFDAVPTSPFRVAPVMVFDGGDDPDVLLVMSGSSASANIAIPRAEAMVGGESITVTNTVGLRQNDVVLMTQLRRSGTDLTPADCFLTQINVADADLNAATGYVEANPFRVAGNTYSAPVGVLPVGTRQTLTTLGTVPVATLIGVRRDAGRSDLVAYDLLAQTGPTVLAENIVDFQALYGVDTSVRAGRSINTDIDYFGDGIVDDWVAPTGDWSAANLSDPLANGSSAWNGPERQRRIKSLRLAIVTVDSEVSRKAVDRVDPTVRVFDGAVDRSNASLRIEHALSAGGAWDSRSRHQVFESIVPVRNLTGGLSPLDPNLIFAVSP